MSSKTHTHRLNTQNGILHLELFISSRYITYQMRVQYIRRETKLNTTIQIEIEINRCNNKELEGKNDNRLKTYLSIDHYNRFLIFI